MHTTRALGHLGVKGGASRLWGIAALCGLLAAIAIAAVGTSPALAASKSYKICTHTSNITDAGTDADVEVRLWGTKASSTKVNLDNGDDNFERGRWDCFGFIFSDLGTIHTLSLDVDCNKCWRLDVITVNGVVFPWYNWVPEGTQHLYPAM
jgi:hypothetical protein